MKDELSLVERIVAIEKRYEEIIAFKDEAMRKTALLLYRVIEKSGSNTITVSNEPNEHGYVNMHEENGQTKLTIGEWSNIPDPSPILR